jgi:hypothetical protein
VTRELFNIAGEYAVASQLARRGHYAQLTFGNRKRTDILVDSANESLCRIEVKAKQDREWPGVQAPRDGDFIILVDFQNKAIEQSPDFYILDFSDWKILVDTCKPLYPTMKVDPKTYCVTWCQPDNWRGLNPQVEDVKQHLEQWTKLPGATT